MSMTLLSHNSIDIGAPEVLTLPTVGLPGKGVGVGSAPAGKFAVQPGYTTGLLTNLDTGDSCPLAGVDDPWRPIGDQERPSSRRPSGAVPSRSWN